MSSSVSKTTEPSRVAAMVHALTTYLGSDGRDDYQLKANFHQASVMASPDERHEMLVRFVAAFSTDGGLPVSEVRDHFSSLSKQYNRPAAEVASDVAGNICERMIEFCGADSRIGHAAKMIQALISPEQPVFKH